MLWRLFVRRLTTREDPPDAYLGVGSETVAVEISTLSQHVDDYRERPIPRFSKDATALRLREKLNEDLQTKISQGCTALLVLKSPIANKRQLKPHLPEKLPELIESPEPLQILECRIFDKMIEIQLDSSKRSWGNKVAGLLINQKPSADILMNARVSLDDRIIVK